MTLSGKFIVTNIKPNFWTSKLYLETNGQLYLEKDNLTGQWSFDNKELKLSYGDQSLILRPLGQLMNHFATTDHNLLLRKILDGNESERIERNHLEKARLERERIERERITRMERERIERERLERESLAKALLERKRMERERLERERLERERITRMERERIERERLERERLERSRCKAIKLTQSPAVEQKNTDSVQRELNRRHNLEQVRLKKAHQANSVEKRPKAFRVVNTSDNQVLRQKKLHTKALNPSIPKDFKVIEEEQVKINVERVDSKQNQNKKDLSLISGYSYEFNLYFIHIPKNAGTSFTRLLNLGTPGHKDPSLHINHLCKIKNKNTLVKCVCIIRNPWDRLVSAYNYIRKDKSYYHSIHDHTKHPLYDAVSTMSFKEFVKYCYSYLSNKSFNSNDIKHLLIIPQVYWITDKNSNTLIPDIYIRYENLENDIKSLLKCDIKLPFLNDSRDTRYYSSYYDIDTIKLVESMYKDDIKIFKYNFLNYNNPPFIYWINLDRTIYRRQQFEEEIEKYSQNHYRISAVDGQNLIINLIPPQKVNSNYELACLCSHIKAIFNAYVSGDNFAIIVEDDMTLKPIFEYNLNINDILLSAPVDWHILQINITNKEFVDSLFNKYATENIKWVLWNFFYYSTSAYIINKIGMEIILNSFTKNWQNKKNFTDLIIDLSTFSTSDECKADLLIYNSCNTYTSTLPLAYTLYYDSVIHPIDIVKHRSGLERSIDIFNNYKNLYLDFFDNKNLNYIICPSFDRDHKISEIILNRFINIFDPALKIRISYQQIKPEIKYINTQFIQIKGDSAPFDLCIKELIKDLDDHEWVFLIMNDKYFINIDKERLKLIINQLKLMNINKKIQNILLTNNNHVESKINNKFKTLIAGIEYSSKKDLHNAYQPQFFRVGLLKNLLEVSDKPKNIDKRMNYLIKSGLYYFDKNIYKDLPNDIISLVPERCLITLGESLSNGELTKNFVQVLIDENIDLKKFGHTINNSKTWILDNKFQNETLNCFDLSQIDFNYGYHHRNGWNEVRNRIKQAFKHNNNGILLDLFVERTFFWNKSDPQMKYIHQKPWIGFVHTTFHNFEIYDKPGANLKYLLLNQRFIDSMKHCCALILLGISSREEIQLFKEIHNLNFRLIFLHHPNVLPMKKFNPENCVLDRIFHIGYHMRNFKAFSELKTNKKKFIIIPKGYEKKFQENILPFINHDIQILNHLSDEQYDHILQNNLIFNKIECSAGSNLISECIMHQNPLLINRDPNTEFYLGENYPFYIDKINNIDEFITKSNINKAFNYLYKVNQNLTFDKFIDQLVKIGNEYFMR